MRDVITPSLQARRSEDSSASSAATSAPAKLKICLGKCVVDTSDLLREDVSVQVAARGFCRCS